jgi:hypothetical protein
MMMFERVDDLREKLVNSNADDMDWTALRAQHARNGRRLQAEAFRSMMIAVGDGIATSGRRIAGAFKGYQHARSGVAMCDHHGRTQG